MERDLVTILISTPMSRRVKSFSIKASYLKLAFFTLISFVIVFLSSSFMFNYGFYKKASHKGEQVNKLISEINVLNGDLYKSKFVNERLQGRLKEIEDKLLEMQELLSKKGIEKKLSVGGEFIPADRSSLLYVDFMEKDINELFDVMGSFPIGTPLSGEINSGFGFRKDPFNSRLAFHSGVDIDAKFGHPVVATAGGVVNLVGWYKEYGKAVMIKHDHGYKTLYGHLSKVKVKKDQWINAGDVIGYAGSTGRSTGPHLHYEVIKNGKKVNPLKYLSLR
jgi:murein DD-endopeptidase MepM/ murein hydrolase activator NlpD